MSREGRRESAPLLEPEAPAEPTGRRVTRFTWLLLLLLGAIGLLAGSIGFLPSRPEDPAFRHPGFVPEAPPVVEATGRLAQVYERIRPATLRIESRCANPLLRDRPIDVGSGFYLSADGKVMTAYHVVRRRSLELASGCPLYYVAIDSDLEEHRLELVGFDAYRDLALLQAKVDEPVPFLELAGELPQLGDDVLAVGNSRGEFLADRSGEVTRLGVNAERPDFASDTIELTAALAPGDSGGPVVDEEGRVVGVVSYISFTPSILSSQSDLPFDRLLGSNAAPRFASYAVPTLEGSPTVEGLLAGEKRDIPVIGFEVAFEYDPRERDGPSLGRKPGVVVGSVDGDGPAARAGLRSIEELPLRDEAGRLTGRRLRADVIVAVDGHRTPTFERLLEVVRARSVGEKVILTVQRGSTTTELGLRLDAYRQVF